MHHGRLYPVMRRALVGAHRHVATPAASPIRPLDELVAGTGAALARDVSQHVLWAPASVVPASVGRSGAWPHFGDRAKPGVICLGPDDKRFANEAQVYHACDLIALFCREPITLIQNTPFLAIAISPRCIGRFQTVHWADG